MNLNVKLWSGLNFWYPNITISLNKIKSIDKIESFSNCKLDIILWFKQRCNVNYNVVVVFLAIGTCNKCLCNRYGVIFLYIQSIILRVQDAIQ